MINPTLMVGYIYGVEDCGERFFNSSVEKSVAAL